jgi:hypothetical protein
MGTMAVDHGSELHLLRFLGRHRAQFDGAVRAAIQADSGLPATHIRWLDFPFDPKSPQRDGEWKGVDFLGDAGQDAWKQFWPDPRSGDPRRNGAPSWDAVGRIRLAGHEEWLLVEAKAHLGELRSPQATCGAGGKSLVTIKRALQATWQSLVRGSESEWPTLEPAWLGRDYQKANRLACLHFLNTVAKAPARLLYVYFLGDSFRDAPATEGGWRLALAEQRADLGLAAIPLERVHEVFLSVGGNATMR